MKLINNDTDYALRAISYIATSRKDVASATDIQDKLQLPRPFLRKILQMLQKEGILKSTKGNKGGFSLALPAEKITLMDVINIFQGEVSILECLLKKDICSLVGRCQVRKQIMDVDRKMVEGLKAITIASIIGCGSQS